MDSSLPRKLTFLIVIASIVTAVIFGVEWFRTHQQTKTLTLATAGKEGEYYAFGQALAKVVAEHNPKIQIKVIATAGSPQNIQLLEEKDADIALVQNDTPLTPSIQAVSFLFPEICHLLARQDAQIERFSDLKGKKIALMPKASGSYALFWKLAQHYGLNEQDFQAMPLSSEMAHRALETGQVDALFRVIALGNEPVIELLQNPNIQLIPIDQGAALQLWFPYLEENQIPRGTYNGAIPIPPDDLSTVAVRALLVSRKAVDSHLIYEITRILYEARSDLVEENVQAALIREPDLLDNPLGFVFHAGAKAYYDQGQPSFIVEYAEPIGLLISVSVLLVSGLWQLRMWLQGTQKNRADFYNLELVQLIQQIENTDSSPKLKEIRAKLFEIFEKVIVDLDKDRISPESFQSFTFTWDVALSAIHHREALFNKKLEITSVRATE